jgi:hypothetical protein
MSGNAIVIQSPTAVSLNLAQKIADKMSTLPDLAYAVSEQWLLTALSPNDPYYVAGDQLDMNDPAGGIDVPAAQPGSIADQTVLILLATTILSPSRLRLPPHSASAAGATVRGAAPLP